MVKRGSRWTKEEDDFLEFAFQTGLTLKEMEEVLEGRSYKAIKSRSIHKGLRRNLPPREKNGLFRCSKCKKYKSIEEFILLGNGKPYCYCNECKTALNKEKYLKNKKEKALELVSDVFKTKIEVNNGLAEKKCPKCNINKDVNIFHWAIKGKKLSSICSECKKEVNIGYINRNLKVKGF